MENELKVLKELINYFNLQLDGVYTTDWGIGCRDGFMYSKRALEHLCELYGVKL